jgi:hypothetical protein
MLRQSCRPRAVTQLSRHPRRCIRALRDGQQKDIRDSVMPSDVEGGQVVWFEETIGSLIGRAEVRNIAEGVASSFSCGNACSCPPNSSNTYLTPGSSVGPMGGTAQFSAMEELRDCNNALFGPYNRTSNSTWSSSDTSVFTVSSGLVSCLQPGSGTVTAQFQATVYGQWCNPISIYPRPSGSVQVYMPQLVGVISALVSGDSNSTISGQAFTLQIEARVPGSNPPQVVAGFSNPVTVTFPTPSLNTAIGESITQNPVSMSQGVGRVTTVLRIVDSTPANTCCRSYTLSATGATSGAGLVKVWFQTQAFLECADCGHGAGYRFANACQFPTSSYTDACAGGTPNYATFAAMANPAPCGSTLLVLVRGNGSIQAVNVEDHTGNSDAYWQTGNPPTFLCLTEGGYQLFGFTFNVCAGTAQNPTVLWRFQ